MRHTLEEVTAREWAQMEHEKTMFDKQAEHIEKLKAMEVESERISSKWTTVFRIPLALIKLPIQLLVVLPLFVYAIRGIEPPLELVRFLKV
jgi:hypothetical protein